MNRLSLLFLLIAGLFSCGDGDDDKKYSFKDQDASGKMDGTSWTYADGFSDVTSGEAFVKLVLEQSGGEGCDMGIPEGNSVIFSVTAEAGVYPLSQSGPSVTLVEDDAVSPNNIFCFEGAIEIITITDTQITGRIDARNDEDSFVNGNFVVDICN